MPKVKNSEVMARSGGAIYNPGGHRGRSGENGAGNHRYTRAEKAAVEAGRAEVEQAHREQARKDAALSRYHKSITKLDEQIKKHGLTLLGTRRRHLTQSDWNKEPLKMRCAKRHIFDMYPRDIVQSRAARLCPTCVKDSYGTPRADARVKYQMRLDEQGMELLDYTKMSSKCQTQDRETGETFDVYPTHVDRWKRSPDDRRIRFVADDDDHVFVFRGRSPCVHHPFIRHLLDTYPVEETELVRGKPLTGIDAMERVIQQFLDEGDKVVNLSLNPSWEKDGTYTWGEIPDNAANASGTDGALAKYMKVLEAGWD